MASLLLVHLGALLLIVMSSRADDLPLLVERRAGGSPYTFAEQQSLLKAHNDYRAQVNAVSMNTLTWDTTLAEKAQRWAEKCIYDHPDTDIYTDYDGLGQNLYRRFSTRTPSVTAPVDAWYKEVRYYNLATNSCTPGKVCGHYTQLVWADTSKVGCAKNLCSFNINGNTYNGWLVACQYSPGGNVKWQEPYVPRGK